MLIVISGSPPKITIDQMVEDLGPVLKVDKVMHLQGRSVDPPTIVQLVGDLSQWLLPLKIAVSIFLAQLAKEAAKDAWKNKSRIAEVLKEQACKPLKVLASAVASTKRRMGIANFRITIGLSIPDDIFGTVLLVEDNDEELIALLIAQFVDQLKDIEAIVKKEMSGPNSPVGQVSLLVQRDGSILVRWMGSQDLAIHEQIVNRNVGAA